MKKILTVVGARPQFIKAAVVSRAIQEHGALQELIVHTGQHFDANMSDVFFDELGIPKPAYNLGIGGKSHAHNTGQAMIGVEEIIMQVKPDMVMVYGDTDSTLAGALAASKLCVPIAHIEAGLRSFNRAMPEEVNRVVTDHVSSLLFTPSQASKDLLAREGIAGENVKVVGDVMYDAVLRYTEIAQRTVDLETRFGLQAGNYVLTTLHRKENTDDPIRLRLILRGLATSNVNVVFPMHPRTHRRLIEFGISLPSNIRVIEPVGYLEMQLLERNARLIATDSGGVQKEAYFHKVACVTLRDETEWTELVDLGVNRVVGTDPHAIAQALSSFRYFDRTKAQIYGDGAASHRIAQAISEF